MVNWYFALFVQSVCHTSDINTASSISNEPLGISEGMVLPHVQELSLEVYLLVRPADLRPLQDPFLLVPILDWDLDHSILCRFGGTARE